VFELLEVEWAAKCSAPSKGLDDTQKLYFNRSSPVGQLRVIEAIWHQYMHKESFSSACLCGAYYVTCDNGGMVMMT